MVLLLFFNVGSFLRRPSCGRIAFIQQPKLGQGRGGIEPLHRMVPFSGRGLDIARCISSYTKIYIFIAVYTTEEFLCFIGC